MVVQNKNQQIKVYEEYQNKLHQIYNEIEKDKRFSKEDIQRFQYKMLSPIGHCQGKVKWLQGEYNPLEDE